MEALLTTFVAALLAEWGDKTQLLAIALAVHFRRPMPILLGIGVAALANSLLAAFGGMLVHGFITLRAISLLVALALVFAGASGLMSGKLADHIGSGRFGPFLTAAGAFFVVEFGDKTQFVTFALAAQYNALAFATAGATAGILAATLPAVLLGDRLTASVPMKAIRIGVALLFLLVGIVVAVNALRLV